MSYKLIFEFKNFSELLEHINHHCDLEILNELIKKPNPPIFDDKRGSHIKNLHEKTKEYHLNHPEMKYHEAMKQITKLNKPINE